MAAVMLKRLFIRGRWCVVTRTGIVIGSRAPRLPPPGPLPDLQDPLSPARGMVWGCIGGLTVWALVLLAYLLAVSP